ncbi:lipoate--protein ligase family protein [Butyricimonas paravirosa]|uniref:lipoate--protein ligase family protein n=1 Tax=Butyricimonas paravirosa TaxID=1472417 RepID=UPI00210E70F5|nr:lipoate--protein ligase family protein [Butyricimonas paravirosa]MCQ4875860.1 lipoate--protein ligase family protein [Butyricimonas paravirosa]
MRTLYINNFFTNIYFNLAAEEFLLKNHSEPIFMLWQNTPSVVLGKHQCVDMEVNMDFAKEKSICVARRYSGGGTVYHDLGNLNLTFIENTKAPDFGKYTRQILQFLNSIGIRAQPDSRLGINIDEFKISGSAQCIYKTRVMYHCTLLYNTDLDVLRASLAGSGSCRGTSGKFAVPSVKSPVANVITYLDAPSSVQDFRKRVFEFFLHADIHGQVYDLGSDEIADIEQLQKEKYATSRWIFDRAF